MDLAKYVLNMLTSDVLLSLVSQITKNTLTVSWPPDPDRDRAYKQANEQLHRILMEIGCEREEGPTFAMADQRVRMARHALTEVIQEA